jgi:hypothetical protein
LSAPGANLLAEQGFTSADYYRRISRALEAGKLHLGFFDNRLAFILMGMAPERLGPGATISIRISSRSTSPESSPSWTSSPTTALHGTSSPR